MACMRNGFVEGLVLDGRYESISPLNHGSFGMVFLAKDRTVDELVAIKCLSKASAKADYPTLNVDESSVERSCHARLGQHPNVVNMIRAFETKAHVYLVLEYCPMGDLYEAIRLGRGPLETENVREFMLQLVGAVEHMHARGLYHRDIKPENIFLAQDGSMKLGDLGLATSDGWSYEGSVGSDRYMAPEQYEPQENGYSPAKADCWAIGICLLNVLFSRNPFITPTESDVLYADFARDNKSLFDIFPNMSEDTYRVLLSALATDPTKRSLFGIRSALESVVSFTTDDDVLDDFCTETREVAPATAHREPLRTPSISSPQVDDNGAFPWSKILHNTPARNGRQLSAIADTESISEDLFAKSETDRTSWVSWAQNSSVTSGLDSVFSTSVKSMALNPPVPRNLPRTKPVPVPNSLPSRMSTLSHIFSKKDNAVSKSWTDLYDEDQEETLTQVRTDGTERSSKSTNSAQDQASKPDPAPQRTGLSEITAAAANARSASPSKSRPRSSGDSGHDEIFHFEESPRHPSPKRTTDSPLSKKAIMDKWAALGNRRRQYKQGEEPSNTDEMKKRSIASNWRSGFGLKVFSSAGGGLDRSAKKDAAHVKVLDWRKNSPAPHHRPIEDLGWDIEWVGDYR